MKFVGVDLHKQTITLCVVDHPRKILAQNRLWCDDEEKIVAYFQQFCEFQLVVETTASYVWFVKLVEPLAAKIVLAHPQKLRVIAESNRLCSIERGGDKLDATVLAEFLALDMVPTSYRSTPRQRDHRRLMRQRDSVQRRITSVKYRMRRLMSHDNANRRDLFSQAGLAALKDFSFTPADHFAMTQMRAGFAFHRGQLAAADKVLKAFAKKTPIRERQQRALLHSIPGVGFVTTEVVLAEIADALGTRSSGLVNDARVPLLAYPTVRRRSWRV